jgi:hypothetical protein
MSRLEQLPSEIDSTASSLNQMIENLRGVIQQIQSEQEQEHQVPEVPPIDNAVAKLDMVFRESQNWPEKPQTPADLICSDYNTWNISRVYRQNVEKLLTEMIEKTEKKKRRFRS